MLHDNFIYRNNSKGRCVGLRSIDFRTKFSFHPKSILKKVEFFESPLVVYFSAIKSKKVFIHDATLTHPLPLVFFGDHFNRSLEDSKDIITIGTHLKFIASDDTARLINDLRNRMNWFLEYKISHPGAVCWAEQSNEVDILR